MCPLTVTSVSGGQSLRRRKHLLHSELWHSDSDILSKYNTPADESRERWNWQYDTINFKKTYVIFWMSSHAPTVSDPSSQPSVQADLTRAFTSDLRSHSSQLCEVWRVLTESRGQTSQLEAAANSAAHLIPRSVSSSAWLHKSEI